MPVIYLPKDTRGFDCAGIPDYQKAWDYGFRFVSGYLGGLFGIKPWQVQAAIDVGFVWQWNYERWEGAAFGGYSVGKQAAEDALAIVDYLTGKPPEIPIIFSGTDTGVPLDKYPACDAYYQATWDICAPYAGSGGYNPLAYGYHLSTIMPEGFINWHWGGDYVGWPPKYQDWSYVDVQQVFPRLETAETGIGCAVDANYLVHDDNQVPFWTNKPQPIGVTDMTDFRHSSQGWVYQLDKGTKCGLSGDYFYGVLGGTLAPNVSGLVVSYPADDTKLAAIPDYKPPTGGGSAPTHFDIQLSGQATA